MSRLRIAALLTALVASPALAQAPASPLAGVAQVVIPQSRSLALHPDTNAIVIESVTAHVTIRELTARTSLEIALRNPAPRQQPAVLLLPVPDRAVVSNFTFEGAAAEPTAQVLPRDEARSLYDSIVRRLLDPALLEFAGHDMIRTSVFPVPAGGTQRVRLTYEHLLATDGDRVDYLLPRSESLDVDAPWTINVEISARAPISTVYSPSHAIVTERRGPGELAVQLAASARTEPGTFRLSCLREQGAVSASLFAYPDPSIGGGYFLLMAGLPATDVAQRMPREVTLVLDRSGSMAGEAMDQAREAARQIIAGLGDDERFNIIDYASTVSLFAAAPVRKSAQTEREAFTYLDAIRPSGGTNIHDALVEALQQPAPANAIPIVLFLTDGLPTIGRTAETDIRAMVEAGNPHNRRVFTFGVGADVNVPLLDRIADTTRATSTYVLPSEDVELAVAKVFKRLHGPVFAAPRLTTRDTGGLRSTRFVHDLVPAALPDLFEDDQLIVLGKYRGHDPITFRFGGEFLGTERFFDFTFELTAATTRNAFVPRLWASRRIAMLIDQVRQDGAAASAATPQQELVDEIMALSTRFGILTEYTAFLAREGTDLTDWPELLNGCSSRLSERAVATRWGLGAVNQAMNYRAQRSQQTLNRRNRFVDAQMASYQTSAVQQMNDLTFFRRGNRWVDSRLAALHGRVEPHETIMIGSDAHRRLVRRLVRSGRNGAAALSGEVLLLVDDRIVLITGGC